MDRAECMTKLREQDLNIIPLKKNDKGPLIQWATYQSKKYEGQISPDVNIGAICGTISGNLVVIDIDTDDKVLVDKILPNAFNRTLVVRTGKGHHIYIKVPELPKTIRLANDICGIDIQSDGTYVVAPTSVHPNGRVYEVISNATRIESVDFRQIIKNLDQLGFKPPKSSSLTEIEKHGAQEGSRNDSMFKLACKCLKEYDKPTAFAYLQTVNDKNKPPLDKKELCTIFESAQNYVDDPPMSQKAVKTSKSRIQKKVKGWVENHFVESILIDSKPYFLCYNKSTGKLETHESIDTGAYAFMPLGKDECGYFPYSFTNSEIEEITEEISKERILDEIKLEIDRFISLDEIGRHLILGDILLTYCLEWIDILHYPFFVGETESGKSSVLHLAKWLAYRCLLGEEIPDADVYNFLGTDEEGCGTIAEDEAQDLWKSKSKINTYKTSYSKGSVKPRIIGADSLGKRQVYYKTFCPKWFAGEKLFHNKGFLERLAVVHMAEGAPSSNIKRPSKDEVDRLNHLRNKLLVWKVQNMGSGLERVASGLSQRDQELWEDFLGISHGTRYFEVCKMVVSHYVNERHEVIQNSLEAKIFACIIVIIGNDLEVKFSDLWAKIISTLPGELDRKTFRPEEYPTKLTYYTLSKILEEKFQARRNQSRTSQEQMTSYVFKKEVVATLAKKYGIVIPIDHPIYVGTLGTQDTPTAGHSEPSGPTSENHGEGGTQ